MTDPKKPDDKQEPHPPTPANLTSTGAPVDERFSSPAQSGNPQHLRSEETTAQQSSKSEDEAPEGEDDERSSKKGSKKRS